MIRSSLLLTFALGCLLALAANGPARAEVIPVDAAVDGRSFSSTKTRTFLWESKKPAATLVMIPGGDGHIGLTDNQRNLGGSTKPRSSRSATRVRPRAAPTSA